ncbi:MAG: hypothetical protein AB7K09_07415 [Planctomycetota bacterium]
MILTTLSASSGCAVYTTPAGSSHGTATVTHVWWYYPGFDVYYCRTTSMWVYYSGSAWVTVRVLPAWIRVPSTAWYVHLDYTLRDPWVQWSTHRSRWVAPPPDRPQPPRPRLNPQRPKQWTPEPTPEPRPAPQPVPPGSSHITPPIRPIPPHATPTPRPGPTPLPPETNRNRPDNRPVRPDPHSQGHDNRPDNHR